MGGWVKDIFSPHESTGDTLLLVPWGSLCRRKVSIFPLRSLKWTIVFYLRAFILFFERPPSLRFVDTITGSIHWIVESSWAAVCCFHYKKKEANLSLDQLNSISSEWKSKSDIYKLKKKERIVPFSVSPSFFYCKVFLRIQPPWGNDTVDPEGKWFHADALTSSSSFIHKIAKKKETHLLSAVLSSTRKYSITALLLCSRCAWNGILTHLVAWAASLHK